MKEFTNLVLCDYKDEHIWINVRASLQDGSLEISGHDLGETVMKYWGDEDYEYWYRLDEKGTKKLLWLIHGTWNPSEMLVKEFGGPDGCRRFRELCDKNGLRYDFYSYI